MVADRRFFLAQSHQGIPVRGIGSQLVGASVVCSEVTPEQVAAAPIAARCVEVVAHPQGGWAHAVPAGEGTKRIYRGNWPTRRAAKSAIFQ